MSSVDEIRATLIEQIKSAYANVERGNGVSLHEAEVIDSCGSDKERTAARRLDAEKRWQDVPHKDIENHYSILCYLDADGLRYYAPAYMIWALNNYKTSASASSDFIIYAFEPNLNTKQHDRKMSRFDNLTPGQRRVICRFLRFMADYGDGYADSDAAMRAMENYWCQFCSAES